MKYISRVKLQCASKKYPLKLFAIFGKTAQNFNAKLHIKIMTDCYQKKCVRQRSTSFEQFKRLQKTIQQRRIVTSSFGDSATYLLTEIDKRLWAISFRQL